MLCSHELPVLRSHFRRALAQCFPHARTRSHFRIPARHFLHARLLFCARCFLHVRSLFSAHPRSLAFPHTRSPFPARTLVVLRSLFPARALVVLRSPALAGSCTPCPLAFPLRFPHARSLFSARPRPLAVYRPLAALCFLLCLALPLRLVLPPPPRASTPPRASPPPRLTSASPPSASPPSASPSQALNAIKTGYRTSRVWIWSSKNGRQGGVGQSSQE
ncbi:hypothetical protein B0H13DRAFT_2356479 [Mycena leptocephala]|nr:hypothetical protein B0H13DRAFT_2356479 [Mycena leptocephala]